MLTPLLHKLDQKIAIFRGFFRITGLQHKLLIFESPNMFHWKSAKKEKKKKKKKKQKQNQVSGFRNKIWVKLASVL